jgi:Animal haem peroxidase
MSDFGHGAVGTREQLFTTLLPLRAAGYPPHLLTELAASMAADLDEVKDGADAEENLWMPAGYTYFGQFIDHDLTFDNTSSLNPADSGDVDRLPTNLRTPRFDLDSLYGDGPDAQPFMYGVDGASLLFKDSDTNQSPTTFEQARQDLIRSPHNGRAIIGDKRNDENSIVSQIQLSFIKFHNAVVAKLHAQDCQLTGTNLFNTARNEVRWAYQKLVIEDFLPRIVKAQVLADLQKAKTPRERQSCYALYTEDKRINLPREFVVAAYRFGHSGVRFGYRLNAGLDNRFSIFAPSNDPNDDRNLLGFDPLPKSQEIDDWGRFFPSTNPLDLPDGLGEPLDVEVKDPTVRLQFAYKIDTTLVDPLTVLPPSVLPTSPNPGGAIQEVQDAIGSDPLVKPLPHPERPSLALLNLLRGNVYKVQSGQAIAKLLKEKGFREGADRCFTPIEPLDPKYLVTRQSIKDGQGKPNGNSKFVDINSELKTDTPLWFYVLAEAQASVIKELGVSTGQEFNDDRLRDEPEVAKTQLGWVGGRIIAEVFYGLMDADKDSYFHKLAPNGKDFQPIWAHEPSACPKVIFANLLKFAGQHITPTPKKSPYTA